MENLLFLGVPILKHIRVDVDSLQVGWAVLEMENPSCLRWKNYHVWTQTDGWMDAQTDQAICLSAMFQMGKQLFPFCLPPFSEGVNS